MRAFLTEHNRFVNQRECLNPAFLQLWGKVKESAQHISLSLKNQKKPAIWQSDTYFNDFEAGVSQDNLQRRLWVDLQTFAHEHIGYFRVKEYDYNKYGVDGNYDLTLSEVAIRFYEKLKVANQPLDRAISEAKTMNRLEQWLENNSVPIGQKLVWISPRGSVAEQYPGFGKFQFVYINIFTKTASGKFDKLTQYVSFDSNTELHRLSTRLLQLRGAKPLESESLIFSGVKPEHPDHSLIERLVVLPAHISLETVQQHVYINQKKWPIDTEKELPDVDKLAFEKQLQLFINFCINQLLSLTSLNSSADTEPEQAASQLKEVLKKFDSATEFHDYLASPEALQLFLAAIRGKALKEQSLTELVLAMRTLLLRWVQDHARNYDQEISPYELTPSNLQVTWLLTILPLLGITHNKLGRQLIQTIKKATRLSVRLPFLRVSSIVICVSGTPTSLLTQSASLFKIKGTFSASVFASQVNKLSVREKQVLLSQLNQHEYVEQKFSNGETWMLPKSYLFGVGCSVDPISGRVFGPCVDPTTNRRIFLDDPRDSLALKMTLAEFRIYKKKLSQINTPTERKQISLLKIALKKHRLSPHEALQAELLIKILKEQLLKKTISVTQLISGDFLHDEKKKEMHAALRDLTVHIENSPNPVRDIQQFVFKHVAKRGLGTLQTSP